MKRGQHLEMGGGAEFDAIRRLLETWGPQATGIGDDAAQLAIPVGEHLVVSTDASVENVHFRREWLTPEEIGARATIAALSDIAAMAATPRGMLLALALPESWRGDLQALARGVGHVAREANTPIIGGNISLGTELSLTLTVLGSTTHPLTRSGAQVGDILFATGLFGGPGAALRSLQSGENPAAAHWERFVSPTPRLREAHWLVEHGARAGIDISDGLLADAAHLARASEVTILIDATAIPCVVGVSADEAMASGEEYELLVAVPVERATAMNVRAFRDVYGIPLSAIGVCKAPEPEAVQGAATVRGFEHLG
jgi:thiamine-monophosphate kinase